MLLCTHLYLNDLNVMPEQLKPTLDTPRYKATTDYQPALAATDRPTISNKYNNNAQHTKSNVLDLPWSLYGHGG